MSLITGRASLDPDSPELPQVTVDLRAHVLGVTPDLIQARVVAPGGGDMLAEFEEFLRRKVIELFYVAPRSPWVSSPFQVPASFSYLK